MYESDLCGLPEKGGLLDSTFIHAALRSLRMALSKGKETAVKRAIKLRFIQRKKTNTLSSTLTL